MTVHPHNRVAGLIFVYSSVCLSWSAFNLNTSTDAFITEYSQSIPLVSALLNTDHLFSFCLIFYSTMLLCELQSMFAQYVWRPLATIDCINTVNCNELGHAELAMFSFCWMQLKLKLQTIIETSTDLEGDCLEWHHVSIFRTALKDGTWSAHASLKVRWALLTKENYFR